MTEILFNKLGTSVHIKQAPKENDISLFLKQMYYKLDLGYSKFFKMDNLSKLGIIGTELLFRKNKPLFNSKYKIGIILQNKSSSLDSDFRHQEGIKKNAVSPAVFVYTLPNIVIGEISIKYQWQSEGVFFIDDNIDFQLLSQYSNILLKEDRVDINLIGWIDVIHNKYAIRLCVVDSQISEKELKKLLI